MTADYWKSRMTNEERRAIMNLDMLSRSFGVAIDALTANRLNEYKFLKRDIKMIEKKCEQLMRMALDGCPTDVAATILRQSRDFVLTTERIAAVRQHDEVVMPFEDEWQFVQIALDSRCSICLKTPAECHACKLRKLLRRYSNEPDTDGRGCGYQGDQISDPKVLNKQERL